MYGYRKSGPFQFVCPVIGRPVPIASNRTSDSQNWFGTGSKPVSALVSDVWLETISDVSNRNTSTKTGLEPVSALERLKSGQYCPVIGRLYYTICLKSGRFRPDFRRLNSIGRLKSGRYTTTRTFEIQTIRNPDINLSGLPNRTSGFRRLTVVSTVSI